MRTVGEGHTEDELARGFVHTLIPIALAYLVAHYFSSLLFQGQALAYLVSDPLGDGSDLLGTSSWAIDYALVGATAIWYVQVAALVAGHVAGLVLAHDRALVVYRQPGDAMRSQVWMLARHGRLHVPRPLAAVGGGMSAVPLAHAGHWYHAVLYLAPVLVVVLALWISSVREKRAARAASGGGAGRLGRLALEPRARRGRGPRT